VRLCVLNAAAIFLLLAPPIALLLSLLLLIATAPVVLGWISLLPAGASRYDLANHEKCRRGIHFAIFCRQHHVACCCGFRLRRQSLFAKIAGLLPQLGERDDDCLHLVRLYSGLAAAYSLLRIIRFWQLWQVAC
jgi:hypothetical protein